MKDDTTPAATADVHRLETDIHRLEANIDRLSTDLRNEMREMAKGLHAAIDKVLAVLVNVDKRLTQGPNHQVA